MMFCLYRCYTFVMYIKNKIKMLKDFEFLELESHPDIQEFAYDGDDFMDFED